MCSRRGLEVTKRRAESAGERVSRKFLWAAVPGTAERDLGGGADGRGGGWAGEEQRQGSGRAGTWYPDPPEDRASPGRRTMEGTSVSGTLQGQNSLSDFWEECPSAAAGGV